MKKIVMIMLVAAMTIASSIFAFADDGEPIAAITYPYVFTGAEQSEEVMDTWANPFKNKGLDVASIQYTVSIPANPKFLTGYDSVMTFGNQSKGLLYICNELVGMNSGGFVDYWPSGKTGVAVYPGKGKSYTVNLVFSAEGVAFYVDGKRQEGSNVSAANIDGQMGTLSGKDMLDFLNTESELHIGDDGNTSYWAEQDMTLTDIIFFKGEVTTPYTLTGTEPKAARVGEDGEVVTEDTTQAPTTEEKEVAAPVVTTESSEMNITIIMIIVVVVIVAVVGVAAMVILSQKRR